MSRDEHFAEDYFAGLVPTRDELLLALEEEARREDIGEHMRAGSLLTITHIGPIELPFFQEETS